MKILETSAAVISRQTRIFVPSSESEEDWAETLLGRVIRPLLSDFETQLSWFWFSRYNSGLEDSEDCNIEVIPNTFKQVLPAWPDPRHRSLRLRYAIGAPHLTRFEQLALQQIQRYGYQVSDFRPYDFIADTGSHRFLGNENRLPGRSQQRARLITQFYMASAHLVMDALVGPDKNGHYCLETNDDLVQNPAGSSFQSLHHVFCNITNAPTDVCVFQKTGLNVIGFGTFVHPAPAPPGGWDSSSTHPIWF
jgi:hypothetical protein